MKSKVGLIHLKVHTPADLLRHGRLPTLTGHVRREPKRLEEFQRLKANMANTNKWQKRLKLKFLAYVQNV